MKKLKQWQGRWACIGGGSAGLGLVLARQLVRQGANVAIVGRDPIRLAQAVLDLEAFAVQCSTSGKIVSFSVDLASTRPMAGVSPLIESPNTLNSSSPSSSTSPLNSTGDLSRWLEWLNHVQLDLAIAAAGKSDRGYLRQLNVDELRIIFEANVSTSFAFGQYCEESLSRGKGTLVHISSLAGIVAAPGMGAYSIAKHAVVALSRQLRLELAPKGIRVLLICPGPITFKNLTNSNHQGRYDELVKQRELPPELAKPAAGKNIRAIDADSLAEKILLAVEASTKELTIPKKVRWLAALGMLFPSFADYMLAKKG